MERDKQSEEVAGSTHGSNQLFFGRKCAIISTKINFIDVDDSILFRYIAFEKISIHFKSRYTAQPYITGLSFLHTLSNTGMIYEACVGPAHM